MTQFQRPADPQLNSTFRWAVARRVNSHGRVACVSKARSLQGKQLSQLQFQDAVALRHLLLAEVLPDTALGSNRCSRAASEGRVVSDSGCWVCDRASPGAARRGGSGGTLRDRPGRGIPAAPGNPHLSGATGLDAGQDAAAGAVGAPVGRDAGIERRGEPSRGACGTSVQGRPGDPNGGRDDQSTGGHGTGVCAQVRRDTGRGGGDL